MNHHDHRTRTSTNATVYEPPVLIPIGDAANVVLGIPAGGDDHLGFIPWRFEFEEDDDEDGTPRAKALPGRGL